MKLNNILIVTLSDFARHFTFPAFWTNRQQFVRDLCPEKVYYLNHEQEQAYAEISKWIQEGEADTDSAMLLKNYWGMRLIVRRLKHFSIQQQ
mgnify:CR=1 FL=1